MHQVIGFPANFSNEQSHRLKNPMGSREFRCDMEGKDRGGSAGVFERNRGAVGELFRTVISHWVSLKERVAGG